MIKDEFLDECCYIECKDCIHYSPCADIDGYKSNCKRLDHKHFQFAVPFCKSYDCSSTYICKEFKPSPIYKWIYEHWIGVDTFVGKIKDSDTVPIVVDGNTDIRYYVKYKDFYNGTFVDKNGELKWVLKTYYKRSKKSPIGWKLVKMNREGVDINEL
jgi:hypothetical protein